MLKIERLTYYRVKKGDDVNSVAECFSVPPFLLARVNGLEEEPRAGQVIIIPPAAYNLYTVRGGDSRAKLCGSNKKYEELNGTPIFFIGMRIFIP